MGDKTKVLVVDDDKKMVKTICDILTVKGYDAAAAFTGEAAVEKVKSDHQDCVLMDIKMPGLDGVEALQLIKGLAPRLPVVLMSAYTTEEQVATARRLGAETVLTKPVDLQLVFSFLSLLRKEESIMIVDDDPNYSRTVGDVLRSRGYRVETEANPDKVLVRLEQDDNLVLLLDLKLGETNGLEVLKAVRAKYPSKPVVLVTGYRDEMTDSIEKGMKIGAYTCLYKPFAMESLLDTIMKISHKKLLNVLGEDGSFEDG
jgi:two-component system, NtrC family, response regulator HydG